MKTIIIISKCLRVTKIDTQEARAEFHFKGAYLGKAIKGIVLYFDNEFEVLKGEEYLIHAGVISVLEGVLIGRIKKMKLIKDSQDLS